MINTIQNTETLNLHQKIVEVRKTVNFLKKDTKGYQYKYVSGTSLLTTIRPKMDELVVILQTSVCKTEWLKTSGGYAVCLEMNFTWVDGNNPQDRIESLWVAAGEDSDPAKAIGKAHTYGERYYLLKFFNIPTDDEDPDAIQTPKASSVGKVQTTKSIKELVLEKAKERFKDPDLFKMWLIDNALAEDVKVASDFELSQILLRLKKDA